MGTSQREMYSVCTATAAVTTGLFWFLYDAFMYGVGPAFWLTGVGLGLVSGLAIGHGFRRVVVSEDDRLAWGFVTSLLWVVFLCQQVAEPVAVMLRPDAIP